MEKKHKLEDESRGKLLTCHPSLIHVIETASQYLPLRVLEGHRSERRQEELYLEGKSKVRGGQSKHNKLPSEAVDVVILPVNWGDTQRFYFMGGFIMSVAASLGINLRYGGDWDSDLEFKDQTFNDLVHFELK